MFYKVFKSKSAFTLMEIIIVLVVISVIAVSGTRMIGGQDNLRRFRDTVKRMERLKRAMIGDERIVQCGRRVDFGYFGKFGVFPSSLQDLSDVWVSVNPFVYGSDAWANSYQYDGPAGAGSPAYVTVESYGSDGLNGGTVIKQDIDMSFSKMRFEEQHVIIYCTDVHGTLLRRITPGTLDSYNAHIWKIELYVNYSDGYGKDALFTLPYPCDNAAADQGLNGGANYGYSHALREVSIGPCRVIVYPSDGVTDAGNNDFGSTNWQAQLCPGFNAIETREVIYSKEQFVGEQRFNVIVVRFPGAAINETIV